MSITLMLGMLIIVFAGFTQGLTSFGFALISMPILSNFIPLHTVVPIVVILSLLSNGTVLYGSKKYVDMGKIWVLVFSSLVAAPLGVLILRMVNANALKVFIGLFIIIFALFLLNGVSFQVRNERLALIPVGILSGLLNGSISLSGPPVALFMSNQGVDKQVFRANITVYALILNILTLIAFWYNGLMNSDVMKYSIWFALAMFFSVYCGVRTLPYISERIFKKVILYLLILSGTWTMISGLY